MINVRDYGAVGDGATDDTAAVQTALDHGGHVYVPGGTYRIAGTPLRIRERTRLELAPDATILRASGPGLIRNRWPDDNAGGYTGRGQIIIEGGTWEMAGHGTGDTALMASAMTLAHAANITVRDTTIRNVPGAHGVDLIGCQGVRIERVTFAGYKADPNDGQPRESIQIDGAYGTYSGDSAPADATPCDDVLISACRFQGSEQLPAPQRAVGSHGYAQDVTGHEHRAIRVVDCVIDQVTADAVWAWKWAQSTIARNTITSPGKNGVVVKDGSWDIDVVHNQIYDAGYSGIWVNGSCNNVTVHGNRVVGSSASAHNTHYGIRVSGSCATCVITDNRVRRRGSGSEARYGLSIADGQRMVHHGNHLTWSGISGSLNDLSTSPTTSAEDAL